MDTTQIELVVSMLGDLGQYSLTGFIVWAVSQFLLKIIGWGLSVYVVMFIVKNIYELIQSAINPTGEMLKVWRIQLRTGTSGTLTSGEKQRTIQKINELIAEHLAKQ